MDMNKNGLIGHIKWALLNTCFQMEIFWKKIYPFIVFMLSKKVHAP